LFLSQIEKGPTWGWAFEALRHAKLQFTPEAAIEIFFRFLNP